MAVNPRVLVVFPGKQASGTGWGGVFKASVAHVQALKAVGLEVTVWTASRPFADKALAAGAEVDYAPCWHSGISPFLLPPCWVKAIKLRRRGLIATLHQGGRTWSWGRAFFPGIPQAGVMHRESLKSYKYFKHLLVLSSGWKDELRASPAASRKIIAVAKNGSMDSHNQPLAPPKAAFPSPREPNDPPVIGFLGRLEHVKGIDILIAAAKELDRRGTPFKLLISGGNGGAYADQVKQAGLEKMIRFPGWTDDPAGFYNQIDIFCLPSRKEPFGLVLIEAMAAGLPVVATDCHGPRDIIIDGVSGMLVSVNSPLALADCLDELLKNPNLRQTLGTAARQRINQEFSAVAVGQSLVDAFKEYGVTSPRL